ncbi:hypothetical protein V5N11_004624 [Cardamine amara subsp. amara]|uniref:Srp40 C-terminal domain-containing protein n=1 Tax=Cardamine amara subsp. amara TaxID=228776 RepID=A0ABD1BJU0_CARAN
MPKTLAAEPFLNPALLAFKPRQVLLIDMGKEVKSSNLESEQKLLLLRSIALYLERCGFSKCFKKFLSEAEIEKKELNSTLPDLEEIYSEFLKKRDQKAVEVKDDSSDDEDANEKKKEVAVNDAMEGVENVKKEKKKKKKETKVEVIEEVKGKETDAEIEDGLKEKKKKKKKSKSVEAESLGDDDDKEKSSKKRKRSEPEVTKEETEDDDEESKRRKKDDEGVQETPVKQTDIEENGNVEKSETKSTNKKSGKGLSNSKEPNKPFQRVNVEEIVFTDNRLKDNSYWAKDGADSGYGAKAQEVLGQVKGRDFRHEKTKKKRGTYRGGGEIDLQSHSVKFDYSDDE